MRRNTGKHLLYIARAPWQMPFQVFCGKKISEISIFFPTIHVQSFTFKESLARHHHKQIDNERPALGIGVKSNFIIFQ